MSINDLGLPMTKLCWCSVEEAASPDASFSSAATVGTATVCRRGGDTDDTTPWPRFLLVDVQGRL